MTKDWKQFPSLNWQLYSGHEHCIHPFRHLLCAGYTPVSACQTMYMHRTIYTVSDTLAIPVFDPSIRYCLVSHYATTVYMIYTSCITGVCARVTQPHMSNSDGMTVGGRNNLTDIQRHAITVVYRCRARWHDRFCSTCNSTKRPDQLYWSPIFRLMHLCNIWVN